jgi:hypothetical protein
MKWPSVSGERVSKRDGASPYTIVETKLADCARRLASKPESQRLYEIHIADGTGTARFYKNISSRDHY